MELVNINNIIWKVINKYDKTTLYQGVKDMCILYMENKI